MKKIILFIFCFTSAAFSNAQSPTFEWTKSMGGANFEQGNSIVVDALGNVYTTGRFSDTADFDPGAGTFNLISLGYVALFISKLDVSGNFVWAKSIADAVGYSIAVDASGNVYTTGDFDGVLDFDPGIGIFNLGSGGSDIFILKLDASGNFVWAKNMGSTSFGIGRSIEVDASGNVYTTGRFNGTVDFDPGTGIFNLISAGGSADIFISKLDASGNFIWAKNMGSTSMDDSYSITIDSLGNVYTTGGYEGTVDFDPGVGVYNLSSVESYDIFISKLNSTGDFVWAKSIGGLCGYEDIGYDIATDISGNVYTTGRFCGTADFDPGAGTFNLTSSGSLDIFFLKLDSNGNFVWGKNIGNASYAQGFSLAVDASENVYTTGSFNGTVDFDPGAGVFNLTATPATGGIDDIFISKLDASGNFVWAGNVGSGNGYAIALDAVDNIYTTGLFKGTADFDLGPGVFNLTATDYDIFVLKMSQASMPVGIAENTNTHSITIFPNPSSGIFTIDFSNGLLSEKNKSSETKICVYDVLGNCVLNKTSVKNNNEEINLSNVAKGIYFVKLQTEEKMVNQKIIVQ